MNKQDISVQLYTTRKFQPYPPILNFIKEAGVVNLELFGLESMNIDEFKNISNNDIINKLSNINSLNSSTSDLFCCLMNNTQLEKLNNKFSEYIETSKELVNITILVDESDLMSPTSSNDGSSNNDEKDTSECERLLAKLYKKAKYVLHITGTAHSLLYNITPPTLILGLT